ncbi:hypothetical protein O6H91_Y160900 [Diphasiastrum complanatum]|nr:hypothetical protein O6H91_Y160900 [Diphasiastrum complanatum]
MDLQFLPRSPISSSPIADSSVIAYPALLSCRSSTLFTPSQPFPRPSAAESACLSCDPSKGLHLLAAAIYGHSLYLAGGRDPRAKGIRKWTQTQSLKQNARNLTCLSSPSVTQEVLESGGEGGLTGGSGGNGDGSGGGGGDAEEDGHAGSSGHGLGGVIGAFLVGWRARVRADPQFAYKVLMEEVVGLGACVLGDMASRSNFGLNELDFVFCTLVVGSIVNFSLMYLLAPTSAAACVSQLPGLFASCPPGHMFEPGMYSVIDRAGTFVYKGTVFAAVGFAAGLVGTAISTLLLQVRKTVDPDFVPQNNPPPTILNAATWALHMGLSSNFRYQALNGLEFALAKVLNPATFKASVIATRGLNNLIGGTSFVMLARLTGSQKAGADPPPKDSEGEEGKLLDQADPDEKVSEIADTNN